MKEIAEFREVIRALINASSSPCLEREIRQAYWQETGVNVDAVLLKVQDRPSLLTFLKTECSEFCAVVEDGQLVKIYRKSSPKTKHLDHFTRAGERNFQQQQQPSFNLQKQHPPSFSQPQAYQQNNHEMSGKYFEEVYTLRCVLGAIFHNQTCYTANMNLLNDPNLTLPVMTLALQGLQIAAANILNMTVSYSKLVSQAILRNQLLNNLPSQTVDQNKLRRCLKGVKQRELSDVETKSEDLKQKKRDNNQNEAIDQARKEENIEGVSQTNTNDQQIEHVDNFCPELKLPSPLLKKDYVVDIHILDVEPSLKFSFTYDDSGLAKLMKEMQALYSSIETGSKLAYDTLQPGHIVAGKIFDIWHRAKVICGLDSDGFIDLEFIDFGTRQKVQTKDVRYLYSKFKQDPIRFSKGQCVLPTKVASMSEAAQKFFAEKALNTKLYGKIVSFSGELFKMKVYDSHGIDFFAELLK